MKKKIGLGSLAIVLSFLGIFLSITFNKNGICYGDKLVNLLGLKAWSNGDSGTHYTLFYMFPLFIAAIFFGYKFGDNWGAKIGRGLSIFFLTLIIISLPFMAVSVTSYETKKNVQQNATQSDYLFNLKNLYIGNPSANNKLLEALEISQFGNYTVELKTDAKPYVLYINFIDPINENNFSDDIYTTFKEKMKMNSVILLALISNADEIHYNDRFCDCIDNIVKIKTTDLKASYGDIKEYAVSKESLHSLLIDIGYYK